MSGSGAWMDRLAMGMSGLCLAHCLAGTLLLTIASTAAGLAWGHEIHMGGLVFAIPLAAIALWRGVKRHGRWLVAALGIIGIGFMAGALFKAHGALAEVLLTVIGVALLGSAHMLNIAWARRAIA